MAWPQITLIILMAINGQPKGKWNFWFTLIDIGLLVWLLNAGGFWK